ncbi:hypothetical protein FRC03_011599 [Tulasnella sp. 419]|nr:hypothetical protein FRC03_011599 [Tulasnella sp. 419]
MSNFNHIATKSSILTIAIQNLFGWASWRSLPTPIEILEARNAIAEAEAMFPNEPWVTEDLIGLLERLRAAVTAFEEAFQAQSEGRIPEVDNSVLPAGLDYSWLQETAIHLRISSSVRKNNFVITQCATQDILIEDKDRMAIS